MATSNCSLGVEVDFFWYGDGPTARPGIEAAVDALMTAISSPQRRWNPYNRAMTRREFTRRLEAACRGELVPVDQIKPIRDGEAEWMFEIRWSGLTVTEQRPDEPQPRHISVEVRLLHAEPLDLGVVAIGLHAHEKTLVQGDPEATRHAQDQEIREAIRRYDDGLPTHWGISRG